jgi:calcineurin-like phosphoesterase family protein
MDSYLITKWNETVSKGDIVYHLGDFSFKTHDTDKLIEILSTLNGKITLIAGNHDMRIAKFYNRCLLAEFTQQKIYLDNLILTHFPMKRVESGFINVHGHIHNNEELNSPVHINVSVEVINYKPISLTEIKERISLQS